MKTTIKIVGVGERRQGESKTGYSYDFIPISFCYEKSGISGYAAASANVNQDALDEYVPKVNDEVTAAIREDYKTGRMYVEAIL